MTQILVTGGSGFIGRALLSRLMGCSGVAVRAALRSRQVQIPEEVERVNAPDLSPDADWSDALRRVDVVVHLAARVHAMGDTASDQFGHYRHTNALGTLRLAQQASMAGVRRFIFLSSIKVNGDRTLPGRPFTSHDTPNPLGPYAMAKLEAEQGLVRIASSTSMDFVIIRPPLIYGPGVAANFRAMMYWLWRRVPLPLGAIHNQRSLVARKNLVDLLVKCLDHSAAANQTFLVADDEDLSTTQLLKLLGCALQRPARLIPVPAAALKLAAAAIGKGDIAVRLCDSLQVDSAEVRRRLQWRPSVSVQQALQDTANHFLKEQSPSRAGSMRGL